METEKTRVDGMVITANDDTKVTQVVGDGPTRVIRLSCKGHIAHIQLAVKTDLGNIVPIRYYQITGDATLLAEYGEDYAPTLTRGTTSAITAPARLAKAPTRILRYTRIKKGFAEFDE